MGYGIKAIAIVCVAAIAAFIIAHIVIPDKETVMREREERKPGADTEQTHEEQKIPVEEIPVVMVDKTPVENPVLFSTHELAVPISVPVHVSTHAVSTPAASEPVASIPPPVLPPQRAAITSTVRVEQAAVCTEIKDRGPVGISDKFPKDTRALYFFTHIAGARDTAAAIHHRWYYENKLIQTSILQIRSQSWRTHSRRNLVNIPEATGRWRVEAVEAGTGRVLNTSTFIIE